MKYYLLKIEQTLIDGVLNEYSNVAKQNDLQSCEVAYYQALANVSADLGKNHTFMAIRIVDSLGNVIKAENIGSYLTEVPQPEPEEVVNENSEAM